MIASHRAAIVLLSLLTTWSTATADEPRAVSNDQSRPSIRCRNGAVVCVSPAAGEVGVAILTRGGNAVDAAVATAFALAVTHPAAGNLGGGGYMLVAPAGHALPPVVFDFRETAPAAATSEMFVDPRGRTAHRRVGTPGTVRGLALAHARLGRLPWRELVQPAVHLARDGFLLDAETASSLNQVLADSDPQEFASLHQAFARPDGQPWRAGQQLVQADLAETLEQIAGAGPDAFYGGRIAELIVAEIERGGGLLTRGDLAAYQPLVRDALRGEYRGYEILAVPPSSSGGTTLIEALNILETFDLRSRGRWSPETLHLMIEAMRRAYRDRACHLGDPAVNRIPPELTTKAHGIALAGGIAPLRATRSLDLAGEIPITTEHEQTTHLSVIDRDRLAVSLTYTLERSYGSRVVVRGAGFLLNDEMNDFAWLPGVTDTQGHIGTPPNQVAPGKRMLSSMCPTVVRAEGQPILITGSPGGRTIINTVLCLLVNVLDFEQELRQAVDAPRLHQAWLPDQVRVEPELLTRHADAIEALRARGHQFGKAARQGDAHSIAIDRRTGEIIGEADRRVHGHAAGY